MGSHPSDERVGEIEEPEGAQIGLRFEDERQIERFDKGAVNLGF